MRPLIFLFLVVSSSILVGIPHDIQEDARTTSAVGEVATHETPPEGGDWVVQGKTISKSRSINAADFGLNPSLTTDQSAALKQAFRKTAEDPAIDTVFIPSGHYYFKTPIECPTAVNLIGDGQGKTQLEGLSESNYLVKAKRKNFRDAAVAHLTFRNSKRTLLIQISKNLQFHQVEFAGGIVRFEGCSDIILHSNVFNQNIGKSAYASDDCSSMTIVNNQFNSIEEGSISLSGHKNCYVAWNLITAPQRIDSGYGGIRLPNNATDNLIENNFIENHGRGIFVLSSSENNVSSETMSSRIRRGRGC